MSKTVADTPGERRARKRPRKSKSTTKQKWCGAAHVTPPSVSHAPHHARLAERRIGLSGIRRVHVHRYTEDDLLLRFPQLKSLRQHLIENMKVHEVSSGKVSLAWGFHVEALLLWWRNVSQRHSSKAKGTSKRPPYDFVWIVEDDVGVAGGSLSDLIKMYMHCHADLLTRDILPVESGWYWQNVHTGENFLSAVNNATYTNREHVQRFSANMFAVLDRLACEGISSWSEMHVPSVARCVRHCLSSAEINSCNIGSVYKWDGRIHWKRSGGRLMKDISERARGSG